MKVLLKILTAVIITNLAIAQVKIYTDKNREQLVIEKKDFIMITTIPIEKWKFLTKYTSEDKIFIELIPQNETGKKWSEIYTILINKGKITDKEFANFVIEQYLIDSLACPDGKRFPLKVVPTPEGEGWKETRVALTMRTHCPKVVGLTLSEVKQEAGTYYLTHVSNKYVVKIYSAKNKDKLSEEEYENYMRYLMRTVIINPKKVNKNKILSNFNIK